MVGRVRVRGQGPVRRRQTTTTFKKGGRVKLMHGGPSARTRHIENEKEEIRRVDRNIRRNEGYKTGGRVKKASGGSLAKRLLQKDLADSRKKLNVHQDPRSGLSSALRDLHDNRSKKKTIRSPHTAAPKKRTLRDEYLKHLRKLPTKPRAKGIPDAARRSLAPTGAARRKKAKGGEVSRMKPRGFGPTNPPKKLRAATTDFHKRKRAAEKDKGKPNTPGEKMRTFQGMYSAGQARNKKTFRGDFDVGKQLRKKRKHHS